MPEGQPRKQQDLLSALMWASAAFLLAVYILPRFMMPPEPTTPVSADGAGGTSEGGGTTAGASGGSVPASASGNAQELSVAEADRIETFTLGSAEPGGPYRMGVTVTNVGAAVVETRLSDFREHVKGDERYRLLHEVGSDPHPHRSFVVERINVDGQDIAAGGRRWTARRLEGADRDGVEFSLEVQRGGSPLLRIVRTYVLPRQTAESGLHDFSADLSIENLGNDAHTVIVTFTGGVGVQQTGGRGEARGFNVGILAEGAVSGTRKGLTELHKSAAAGLKLFDAAEQEPGAALSWVALDNQYFTCTLAPQKRGSGGDAAGFVRQVWGADADGLAETTDDATLRFITHPQTLSPAGQAGSTVSLPVEAYLGPKASKAFKSVEKYRARNYHFQIAVGFGWCTFTWLVEFMIWLLNVLDAVTRDYGIAIIILVLLVRTLLHPLTKAGQVSMVRMQKRMGTLQGKFEEIKRKYPNDRLKQSQEQSAVLREAGINPAGQLLTCLPMFFQVPIWAALYLSLSTNILMRHEPFLWTWPADLTAPDALVPFSSAIHIPLMGPIHSFNLLPFLLGISMYIQQKLMPKPTPPPNQTPEQKAQMEMMQKMMPIMSVMMVFFFYSAPSGLNLYIMASSIFGAIEQKRIRAHIAQEEAAGTFDKPKEKSRSMNRPKGRFALWLERVQKMAEEAQRQQSRRPTRGK